MNKPLLIASILAVYVMGYYGFGAIDAYAQYLGNVGDQGETGARTLEEQLELARRAVEAVKLNPQAGSGTPFLAADGVIGAIAISAAVFGSIAAVLFYKGKQGKYAAQGRG
jgi:dihydrodipicolinate synthase/N-acetylneuraminate lyase